MRERRNAACFFWTWLIVATAMSVTGNVAHALLHAPAGAVWLAAGAALVPPVVLLAATHSVAVLVRTHAGGITYWAALLMTVTLAACAFVLSFDALRSLALGLGLPTSIAWLWPCAVDVAIAQATLCLLSLSRHPPVPSSEVDAVVTESHSYTAEFTGQPAALDTTRGNRAPERIAEPSRTTAARLPAPSVVAAAQTVDPPDESCVGDPADWRADATAIERWQSVAESLVQEGVTSKDPRLVAAILAQHEAGVPRTTIGRTHRVHHTTVGRILSAADSLSA